MKKLFVSEDWFSIQQVAQLLDANRIPYVVKNEFSLGAIGELSPFDAIPEVWLIDDDWYNKAKSLVDDLKHMAVEREAWQCSHCKEHNEASFDFCWSCGAPAPAD